MLLKLKKDAPLSYEALERTADCYKTRCCVSQMVLSFSVVHHFAASNDIETFR